MLSADPSLAAMPPKMKIRAVVSRMNVRVFRVFARKDQIRAIRYMMPRVRLMYRSPPTHPA